MVVVLDLAGLLRDEQGRRLGEMAVEQLVEFVADIHPRQRGRDQPDADDQAQHQRQQPALQRPRELHHAFGDSRVST